MWNDGLSPDGSRILTCGLSYLDIWSVAGVNQREAADRLGVSHAHLNRIVRRLGLSHLFPDLRPRTRCISAEDIIDVAKEGYTIKDSAALLGVHVSYLKALISRWELSGHFPTSGKGGGKASHMARVGYCN